MALFSAESLARMAGQRGLHGDSLGQKKLASDLLKDSFKSFDYSRRYDVFLSHSFDDARHVYVIYRILTEYGLSVYVDWIEDKHLDRSNVTTLTATVLRNRLGQSRSLLYCTSSNAVQSKWMPWELGLADGKIGRVAILPIKQEDKDSDDFKGVEYLGLYPYIDTTGASLWVHDSPNKWIALREWLNGANPTTH